jgi:hypothetical protein
LCSTSNMHASGGPENSMGSGFRKTIFFMTKISWNITYDEISNFKIWAHII